MFKKKKEQPVRSDRNRIVVSRFTLGKFYTRTRVDEYPMQTANAKNHPIQQLQTRSLIDQMVGQMLPTADRQINREAELQRIINRQREHRAKDKTIERSR